MQKTIPYYDRKKKLWRVRLADREKGGLHYTVEEGTLDYVVCEYANGGLYFPFWKGNKVYKNFEAHAHSFEEVLGFLLDDPVTFSITGFEEYYSAQEIALLEAFQKKLLEDINKKIIMVRHGESMANTGLATSDPAGIPLTEKGRSQAEHLAENMTVIPDLIIVSPYLRARQTADPLIKRFPQARVECWPEVREFAYLAPASCRDTTAEESVKAYWQAADPYYIDGDGAESFSQFMRRVDTAIQKLKDEEARNIVVFTHGQFMRALDAEYMDGSFRNLNWRKRMELYRDVEVSRVVAHVEVYFLKM
jgi:broad specificity phosphatase PhoE